MQGRIYLVGRGRIDAQLKLGLTQTMINNARRHQSCIKYLTTKYLYQYQYQWSKYQYKYKYCA